jgi:putative transposase
VDVFEDAVRKHGKPEIINSDQGVQFTSLKWTSSVEHKDIKVSMDGKGRATDNRWIERFWRTLKHQYIYLNPANEGLELFENIKFYIGYYNTEKVHQTINGIPDRVNKKSIRIQKQILTKNQAILV